MSKSNHVMTVKEKTTEINNQEIRINRFKLFFKDTTLNLIAFGLYIAIQQLLILPIISKSVNAESFANVVLIIAVLNILTAILGEELGNTKLIRNIVYKNNKISGDFNFLISIMLPISAIISLICCFIMNFELSNIILFIFAGVLGNIRLFAVARYRLNQDFIKVIKQNSFYVIGALLGLLLFSFLQLIALPFIFGEIFASIYIFSNIKIKSINFNKTREFKNTLKTYFNLSGISLVTNIIYYSDRFIIFPLLGPVMMAIYFSAVSMSKMIALIINPFNGVFLARLAKTEESSKVKIKKYIFISFVPLTVIFWIVSMIISYWGCRLLYPEYFDKAVKMIIPIGLATAFSSIVSIIQPVLLRFLNTKIIFFSYLIYAVLFAILGYIFSINLGIMGFAISNCIAKFIQMILFILLLLFENKIMFLKKLDNKNECY